MRHCNAICKKYVAKLPETGGRYANGQKRCNVCDEYIFWDGNFCPCCGSRLRLRARNGVYREKYLTVDRI
jgi:rRNA maturation endonuclease Nob1